MSRTTMAICSNHSSLLYEGTGIGRPVGGEIYCVSSTICSPNFKWTIRIFALNTPSHFCTNCYIERPLIKLTPICKINVCQYNATRAKICSLPLVLEASMHNRRDATSDTPHIPESDALHGPRRSRLVRGLVACAAMLVAS